MIKSITSDKYNLCKNKNLKYNFLKKRLRTKRPQSNTTLTAPYAIHTRIKIGKSSHRGRDECDKKIDANFYSFWIEFAL